jgi:hypothetical protein
VFQRVGSPAKLRKARHQRGTNLWRAKRIHNCERRSGEYWRLQFLAWTKSARKRSS